MFEIVTEQRDVDAATAFAIALAKQSGADEVTPDHLLLGCLQAISRFGVIEFGNAIIDLEVWGVNWLKPPEKSGVKVSYSDEVVQKLDRAVMIARSDGSHKLGIDHLLAAFAGVESGIAGEIKRTHGMTSAMWRAAAAGVARNGDLGKEITPAPAGGYLSPEDAAVELGIHVQTVRTYIRSGKLPALRLAGERAIRIRREDLYKLLEPVQPEN